MALHATDVYSKCSFYVTARPENSQDAQGAFSGAWFGVCGQPKGNQMDGGGERSHEMRMDLCSERRTKRQFYGAGAHPRIPERRNGIARGFCYRLVKDDGFLGKSDSLRCSMASERLHSG